MDIAIDVRSLMEGRHSGVEEYTVRIIEGMAKVAPMHTYHLFYNSLRPVFLPAFPGNVHIHSFSYPNKVFNALQWSLRVPKWDFLVDADVFFVPNPRLVPLSEHVPLVSVAHDLSFERFPEFLTMRRRAWHEMMQPRYLMKRSRKIIAVSAHTKSDLVSLYGIPDEKISVVHSGIIGKSYLPSPVRIHEVRQRYGVPRPYILYFGALEPRKNIPSIIQAFTSIADTIPHHLVIAGESGWRQDEIYQEVNLSQKRKRIRIIGFVDEEDKRALYAGADVFVYPSFYEGFGFPPLEALASGTPVITSFNSSLPEIVGRWATLVDPYHTSQLAAAMKEMAAAGLRIPNRTRSLILQTYSWVNAARKTIRVIESAV